MSQWIQGAVEEVLYTDRNGSSIVRIRSGSQAYRVVGMRGVPKSGEIWKIEGKWQDHPIHGTQFYCTQSLPAMHQLDEELIALLSGEHFVGIGTSTASKIAEKYGNQFWDVAIADPERFIQDGFITTSKAQILINSLRTFHTHWELVRFLSTYQLPWGLMEPLTILFQEDVIQQIHNNPYRLLTFINWKAVDFVARQLGLQSTSVQRVQAGMVHVLYENFHRGNTAMMKSELLKKTSTLLSLPLEFIVPYLYDHPLITEISGTDMVQLVGTASQEDTIATVMTRLATIPKRLADKEWVEQWLNRYEIQTGRQLHTHQREAVHASVFYRLLIITGGPGTGKTTIIDAIRAIFRDIGNLSVEFAAPTGRAAKRLQAGKTLHRLFNYSQRHFSFEGEKKIEFLVVDECSMVDLRLWHAMANSTNKETRLILVGDPNQLPPVGPGQIFQELVQSVGLPKVGLTQIHRQKQDNPIPFYASLIQKGQAPHLLPWKRDFHRGVYILEQQDEQLGVEWVTKIMTKVLPSQEILLEEIQILSPIKNGISGTRNINKRVREELRRKDITSHIRFAIGDRVIQTVNNYDLGECGIMNGTTGTVLNQTDEGIAVDFEGEVVKVHEDALEDLDHAFAISVHKSQGSQYRVVIIPLFPSAGMLLHRQMIYTAITRATDLVIVIGSQQTFYRTVSTLENNRTTAFNYHLARKLGR